MAIEPNEFDNDLLKKVRLNQEDPIQQYIIVRSDVGMSFPKAISQVAHGSIMWYKRYEYARDACKSMPSGGKNLINKDISEKWFNESFRKIVVRGNTKDFEKIKNDPNLYVVLVKDAGLTEVEPETETVIVTWPMKKSTIPKILSRLRLLQSKDL